MVRICVDNHIMAFRSPGGEPNQASGYVPARRHHDGPLAAEVPASTLIVEIDGFDSFEPNKRRRKILDQVSWVITDTMRRTDAVYRHGEDWFCVVMAQTPEAEALGAADRLRVNVESMPLLADEGVTVTVAVAAGSEADLDWSIARAEDAIAGPHEANRVIRANDSTS